MHIEKARRIADTFILKLLIAVTSQEKTYTAGFLFMIAGVHSQSIIKGFFLCRNHFYTGHEAAALVK